MGFNLDHQQTFKQIFSAMNKTTLAVYVPNNVKLCYTHITIIWSD